MATKRFKHVDIGIFYNPDYHLGLFKNNPNITTLTEKSRLYRRREECIKLTKRIYRRILHMHKELFQITSTVNIVNFIDTIKNHFWIKLHVFKKFNILSHPTDEKPITKLQDAEAVLFIVSRFIYNFFIFFEKSQREFLMLIKL